MLTSRYSVSRYSWIAPSLLLFASLPSIAGAPMKCVDGSGRVIYTEMSSCADALRAAPPPPLTRKSPALIQSEDRIKSAEDKAKFYRERAAKIRSEARQRVIDSEYRERQRLMAADEREQQECELMKVESDRRYNDMMAHGKRAYWENRSTAFDKEMELKCGHEVRLRR
jgi:hypothetical protein